MVQLAAAAPAAGTAAATTAAAGTAAAGAGAAAGTSLFTASNLLTALSVGAMVRQGQAAKVAGKVQAEQIKDDAINREVNRRRRLVASLASQNATRAASGIAYLEGSSRDAALEDIRTGEGGALVERAGSGAAAASAIREGGYRAAGSYINAGASLLDQVNRNIDRG